MEPFSSFKQLVLSLLFNPVLAKCGNHGLGLQLTFFSLSYGLLVLPKLWNFAEIQHSYVAVPITFYEPKAVRIKIY